MYCFSHLSKNGIGHLCGNERIFAHRCDPGGVPLKGISHEVTSREIQGGLLEHPKKFREAHISPDLYIKVLRLTERRVILSSHPSSASGILHENQPVSQLHGLPYLGVG